MFAPDGTLNRAALAAIAFSDPGAERRALEGILHPLIQRTYAWHQIEAAEERGAKVVILDVPLLFETGMDVLCDETWSMTADRGDPAQRA